MSIATSEAELRKNMQKKKLGMMLRASQLQKRGQSSYVYKFMTKNAIHTPKIAFTLPPMQPCIPTFADHSYT